MKKNGFTLIELMAVIIIIGVIAVIAVPIVNTVLQNAKESAYETQKAFIEKAGKAWAIEHVGELPDGENPPALCMSIGTLMREGYLENEDIKNPQTNENLESDRAGVKITFESENYKVVFLEDIQEESSNCDNTYGQSS